VGEEMVRSDTLAMLPADIGQLAFYSRTGEIPKDVRDALAKAISLKQAIIDTDRQIAECSKQVNDIVQDQSRIRENMKTVEQKSKYYEDLLAKLSTQETQIEKLQGQRDDLQHKRDQQQKDLEDYLGNLNVG
jgi:chromosome segregation ATPase